METVKAFKYGWFGDGGLGERLIQLILDGRKTCSSCPAYDPVDSDLEAGDKLDLVDKHGKKRARLVVTLVEHRPLSSFDQALAEKQGTPLDELITALRFANGRELRPDEEMRVTHFVLVSRA